LFLDPRTDVLRNRFENAVVDALTSLEYLRATCSPPYYLMGYSFGGFIAVITAAIDGGISAFTDGYRRKFLSHNMEELRYGGYES
jgi:dienelactone hydrolase